jgi:hypothetical protein
MPKSPFRKLFKVDQTNLIIVLIVFAALGLTYLTSIVWPV